MGYGVWGVGYGVSRSGAPLMWMDLVASSHTPHPIPHTPISNSLCGPFCLCYTLGYSGRTQTLPHRLRLAAVPARRSEHFASTQTARTGGGLFVETTMIEVTIDSIRVSLMSQNRIVVLREDEGERFLPIWIGPFEADSITMQLQGMEVHRPLTHDLLKNVIETLGAEVLHIIINGLEKNTYFARIVLDVDGDSVEIDSRPSDAIALAVRVSAPIYVTEEVMDTAALQPEEEMNMGEAGETRATREAATEQDDDLGAFSDFLDGLDLDNLLGNS